MNGIFGDRGKQLRYHAAADHARRGACCHDCQGKFNSRPLSVEGNAVLIVILLATTFIFKRDIDLSPVGLNLSVV
jgi:hypothetical protein